MMARMNSFILLIVTCSYFTVSEPKRLHEQIYSSIEGGAACFRRLNGTHQAGCSSSNKGAVGVVQMIQDLNDAQWLIYNATAGPYVAVVSTALFYNIIDLFMAEPVNVAGIIVYDKDTIRSSSFSQESQCPNEYSSSSGNTCSSSKGGGVVWNEKGTGLLRRDIPYPIFYFSDAQTEEIKKIEKCYTRYNLDRANQQGKPLCSIQLNSFMFAAVNSVICLRRSATLAFLTPTKVCDPLGDRNVYFSLFPRGKEVEMKKKPVTLVTARIDSSSLFDGVAPGAASSVVGMVSLITSAVTLSKMIPVSDANLHERNVIWTLFNGETFDYIGSQRVAYDLSKGVWPEFAPLTPSDIRLHIELGQIGGSLLMYKDNASWPMYAFAPYGADMPPEVRMFLLEMNNNVNTQNMSLVPELTKNLPPSSLHSFRRILKNETESGDFPEVLIVDHNETFTNMFYESVLDDYNNIGFNYYNITIGADGKFISTNELLENGTMKQNDIQVKISRLATALSRTLYQQVTGSVYTGSDAASAHMVDELLYCFLKNQACRPLMAADFAPGEDPAGGRASPLYVGVATWPTSPAMFAAHLLALLAGEYQPLDRPACDALSQPGFSYYWLRGWNHSGVCVQTTMNYTQALSPAFIVPNYDMGSGLYSTWTESVWQSMWARVFVSSSGVGARSAALSGAASTILVTAITLWLRRHANVIFNAPTPVVSSEHVSRSPTVNC